MDEIAKSRFWAKVDKSSDCWEWTGAKKPTGYGLCTVKRKIHRAHRLSYEMAYGPIPDGLCVCHRCDNPSCVNPDHLFLGTIEDNMRDMVSKGRNSDRRGAKNAMAKLNSGQAAFIRSSNMRQSWLATMFGVSNALIHNIKNGRHWTDRHTFQGA